MNSHQSDNRPDRFDLSRRGWLRTAGFAFASGLWTGPAALRFAARAGTDDDDRGLIVRSLRPLDLETPVSGLGEFLTPNDRFFVRSHFGAPVEGLPWTVRVGGLVGERLGLGVEDLGRFERVTLPAVLQCSGNGRAKYRPVVPGVVWDRGAVGHAEWSGVRLADVLKAAKPDGAAAHVHFLGADGPPAPKTPAFLRSLPIARALDPSTILATSMNGEPLPHLHGGPVRLVVPTWTGNHWMKWVREITVSRDEAPGFYQQTGYKMPKTPTPPGTAPAPSDLIPVTTLNVKSLITSPADGSKARRGSVEVRGVAWTGDGHVTGVEVSTDRDRAWRAAALLDDPRPGSWRRWRLTLDGLAEGPNVLMARATDSNGQSQPEATPWNRSGYLWNGIDRVTISVG